MKIKYKNEIKQLWNVSIYYLDCKIQINKGDKKNNKCE